MTEYVMKYDGSRIIRIYKDGEDVTPKSREDYETFEPKAIKDLLTETISMGIRSVLVWKPKIKSIEVKVTTAK